MPNPYAHQARAEAEDRAVRSQARQTVELDDDEPRTNSAETRDQVEAGLNQNPDAALAPAPVPEPQGPEVSFELPTDEEAAAYLERTHGEIDAATAARARRMQAFARPGGINLSDEVATWVEDNEYELGDPRTIAKLSIAHGRAVQAHRDAEPWSRTVSRAEIPLSSGGVLIKETDALGRVRQTRISRDKLATLKAEAKEAIDPMRGSFTEALDRADAIEDKAARKQALVDLRRARRSEWDAFTEAVGR